MQSVRRVFRTTGLYFDQEAKFSGHEDPTQVTASTLVEEAIEKGIGFQGSVPVPPSVP
jgi:hypothetical protein